MGNVCRVLAVAGLVFFLSVQSRATEEIEGVLDRFHQAAATGDFQAYFATMTEDAVFLGTDGTERWQGEDFRVFARPHFAAGGWRYVPVQRNVDVDESRGVAWFDELLSHERLGQCRGSGLLFRQQDGTWKIAQYNLSVPIPNELVDSVAARIKAGAKGGVTPQEALPDAAAESTVGAHGKRTESE
jgi:ketosteroid isomerase-like protein